MAQVVLENLCKVFKGPKNQQTTAVHNFNLVVADGEFLVLVGPSGCGKSTTLRMIAGLEEPTGGQITIDHKVVNEVHPKDRDVAMVFQNYALYPHMTVYDNLAFGLKLRKFARLEIDRRVRETAETLGLLDLLAQKPKSLSGGQRQRVAVGRAMVRQPKVFLFDEPLSNLDAQMRLQMRTEISRLHDRLRATVIYVTHDQTEAMTMGDRIVVMKDGHIQQVAPPVPLYQQPHNLFVAGFIGSPAMNLIPGMITADHERLYFCEQGENAATPTSARLYVPALFSERLRPYLDRSIFVGLRPEHLRLSVGTEPGPGPEAKAAPLQKGELLENQFRAAVDLVEPLGPETLLHCRTKGQSWLARVAPESSVRLHDEVILTAEMGSAHFFDPVSGLRLGIPV